jgi:zinc/manganese transport system permease protein
MTPYDLLIGPFVEFPFLRRALVGSIAVAVGAAPIGVLLMLRRMSLTGDAMAHAILPGVAAGFLVAGLNLFSMTLGGLIAGLVVALGASAVARATAQREDASLAAFYLISLALGVVLISLRGSSIDLLHVLFGNVLALDNAALFLVAGVASVTLLTLALLARPLIAECLDPMFLRAVSVSGPAVNTAFLGLVVLNLVGGFQALGTLLCVGLMMLPAATARFWTRRLEVMMVIAAGVGIAACAAGLLLSFHLGLPSGPAIVLSAGACYLGSLVAAPRGLLGLRAVQSHRAR